MRTGAKLLARNGLVVTAAIFGILTAVQVNAQNPDGAGHLIKFKVRVQRSVGIKVRVRVRVRVGDRVGDDAHLISGGEGKAAVQAKLLAATLNAEAFRHAELDLEVRDTATSGVRSLFVLA